MKMKVVMIIFISLVGLLLFAGCNDGVDENGDNADVVNKSIVYSATADRIDAFGIVNATTRQSVVIEFEALVLDVAVREGEQVLAGDPLVSLNLDYIQAEIDRKNYNLNMEQVNLENIKRVLIPHEKSCSDCKTILYSGYDRFQKQSDIAFKEQQIALINREIRLLRGQMNRLSVKDSYIIADMENALVYEVSCNPGDYVAPGQPLLILIDLDSLIVQAEVPEEFISDVKIGARAYITPIADPSREYLGEVKGISSMATRKSGETIVLVDIVLDDHDGFLKLNYNVDVAIER